MSIPDFFRQFSSVAQSCPILCDPVDCSMLGFPVLHQFLELAQTHQISDAIQPSQPLSPPSPAFNLSQHQGLFQWVRSLHQVAKVLAIFYFFVELEMYKWFGHPVMVAEINFDSFVPVSISWNINSLYKHFMALESVLHLWWTPPLPRPFSTCMLHSLRPRAQFPFNTIIIPLLFYSLQH